MSSTLPPVSHDVPHTKHSRTTYLVTCEAHFCIISTVYASPTSCQKSSPQIYWEKPTKFKSRIRLLHCWDGYNTSLQRAYLWSIAFLIRPIHDVYFIFQQVNLSFDLILDRVCAALIQIENRVAVLRSLTRLGLRLRAKSLSWLSKYFYLVEGECDKLHNRYDLR